MKQIFRYGLAVAAAVLVVAGSVIVPPAIARSSDNAFLNVVQADSSAMGSYQYKPTKYQKVRVLYERQLRDSVIGVGSWPYYSLKEENVKQAAEVGNGYDVPPYPVGPYDAFPTLQTHERFSEGQTLPKTIRMSFAQAEKAAREALDDLGRRGGLPYYGDELSTADLSVEKMWVTGLKDPIVSGTSFYFWEIYLRSKQDDSDCILLMDDEEGTLYGVTINYQLDDQSVLKGWDNMKSAKEKVGLFLEGHGLQLWDKIWGASISSTEDLVYSTDDSDYEAILHMQTSPVSYSVMLKPSDL